MKPIVILAFANDRGNYLPLITREKKSIYKSLLEYDDKDCIKIRSLDNTSIEEIFNFFNRYQDQVVIFHYGGHADSKQLILETPAGERQPVDAIGLARLMGQQKELRLVFLNGCATKKQVELLLAEGVRAVIATSVPIGDQTAVEFAEQFYDALKVGKTIENSFKTAGAFIQAKPGTSRGIKIYRDVRYKEKIKKEKKEIPWGLYVEGKNREVLDWKIPDNPAKPDIKLNKPLLNVYCLWKSHNTPGKSGYNIMLENAKESQATAYDVRYSLAVRPELQFIGLAKPTPGWFKDIHNVSKALRQSTLHPGEHRTIARLRRLHATPDEQSSVILDIKIMAKDYIPLEGKLSIPIWQHSLKMVSDDLVKINMKISDSITS